MSAPHPYYSVATSAQDSFRQVELKIKRSRFIASLAYAGTMEEAKAFISKIAKENHRATHNCWAYIVGEKGNVFHASDAGEPAGTAGKPMLNVLQHHDMTCVAAVVTRYYGGVKLGVRGLIEAYGLAVEEAVQVAPLVALVKTAGFEVTLAYGQNDNFLSKARALGAEVKHTDYAEEITHALEVQADAAQAFEAFLTDFQNQGVLVFHPIETD